jgi:hypothetical protein
MALAPTGERNTAFAGAVPHLLHNGITTGLPDSASTISTATRGTCSPSELCSRDLVSEDRTGH